MPDMAFAAAILTGSAILLPTLHKNMPKNIDKEQVLCRTGTRIISPEETSALALKITRAGLKISPEYFAGIRATIAGGYILAMLFFLFFNSSALLLLLLTPVIYFLPSLWLKSKTAARQREIKVAMADFTIMLSTSLEAGSNVIQAMEEAAHSIGGVLGEEIRKFIMEIMSGTNFSAATQQLILRNNVDELSNMTKTIDQIYVQGAPGADTMRSYSEQMRITRKFETMEAAGKLAVQLIFPVLIFIMVPILLAIGYPAVYGLMNAF